MTESTYDTYGGVDDTPSSAGGHYTSGHTTPVWSHPHSHPHAHAGQQGAGTPYYHPPPPPYGRPMQPPLLLGTGSSMSNMSSGMMIGELTFLFVRFPVIGDRGRRWPSCACRPH
jgi:hypothetical protein